MKSKLLVSVVMVNMLSWSVFAFTQQTQTRVIEWSKSPIGSNNETVSADLQLFRQIEGVEIVDIIVDGKSVTIGEPFTAADDWLKTLTVRVKNISNQKFLSVQVTLIVPEIGVSPDIVYCYGCEALEKEKGVLPGDVVELKILDGGFYDWVVSRIQEKRTLSRISKAEIHHMYVQVPNTPTWFSGCVKTVNPKNACRHRAP